MRANAYIDGFNLYHGAVKERPACKWLDLDALCRRLLPAEHDLHRIRYFTARVGGSQTDPHQPQRQDVYLRALSRYDHFTRHDGRFQTETDNLPLVDSSPERLVKVRVIEEKGSDVNLATYLMLDACEKDAGVALVISDDFDLEEPLRIVRESYGMVVGVASPRNRRELSVAVGANFFKTVREELLLECQFPNVVLDADMREVHRPPAWN